MQDAHAFEPTQHGRIYIEKLNGPLLYIEVHACGYSAGPAPAIERGWLKLHDRGTFISERPDKSSSPVIQRRPSNAMRSDLQVAQGNKRSSSDDTAKTYPQKRFANAPAFFGSRKQKRI